MGRSYATGLPVKEVFLQALGPTLDLMIPDGDRDASDRHSRGVFAALRRNTPADRAMMVASVMGYAVPNFFMGILLLLVFSIWLGWLPSYGNATAAHYIMPIITMATTEAAIFSRYARSAMIESMRLPSVKAAMMRGLPRTRIIWLHALPNAMLSILTILGFFLGTLVAGAVITETVFSWPGVGKLLVQSVANRDIPVVQMIVLATGRLAYRRQPSDGSSRARLQSASEKSQLIQRTNAMTTATATTTMSAWAANRRRRWRQPRRSSLRSSLRADCWRPGLPPTVLKTWI